MSTYILPFGKSNPIIYDNDSHSDTYTDELLMILASAGEVDLRGIITTSPENCCVNIETYNYDAIGREEIYRKALRSGLKNLPFPVRGPSKPLIKPPTGRIEDTVPLDTPGSRLIVSEAKKASGEKPIVLVMGGPLTAAADAFLLDGSIADNIVIYWLGGTFTDINDYNGAMDSWSAYIVMNVFKLVQFPAGYNAPLVPKQRLDELPYNELTQYMKDKRLPHVNPLPCNMADDADSQPVIALINKDYVTGCKRMRFGGWHQASLGYIPYYTEDADGGITVITGLDQKAGTNAWWQSFKNEKGWHGSAPFSAGLHSLYAAAFPVGPISRIEAEDFDLGGEGVAFHCQRKKDGGTAYRAEHVGIITAHDGYGGYNMGLDGGYCLTGLTAGDWFKYSLDIEKEGMYLLSVRAASAGRGGAVRLDIGGCAGETVSLPDTEGVHKWQTVGAGQVYLKRGGNVMSLNAVENGEGGTLGNINYISIRMTFDKDIG